MTNQQSHAFSSATTYNGSLIIKDNKKRVVTMSQHRWEDCTPICRKHEPPREKSLNENVVVQRLSECNRTQHYDIFEYLIFILCMGAKRSAKGNKHRRKVRRRSLQKGKRFIKMPKGCGGLGGSALVTEVQERIELNLHEHVRLTALCLAMVGTPFCRTHIHFFGCKPRHTHLKKEKKRKEKKKTQHMLIQSNNKVIITLLTQVHNAHKHAHGLS